jgi:GNAT superfamily N-acetyltransferase
MPIRPAEPADALAVARVHVRSWQAAYRGLIADVYLDGLRSEERAAHYDFSHVDSAKPHTQVAIQDGRIVGFATTLPARDADCAGAGELAALYVDPENWGQGVGAALMGAARDHLAGAGFERAVLWVLDGNERAIRFYARDGWRADDNRRTQVIWGIELNECRYCRGLE